jgi:serine/threonine protein kinase
MASLRKALRALRIHNHDRNAFVPEGSLDALITPHIVRKLLEECQIDAWNVESIQKIILEGAKKIFAVLVLMREEGEISRFIEFDDFQDQTLDSKLPISREKLKQIIPDNADQFFEEQWCFTAPVFAHHHIHRYFSKETVLPFTSVRPLGKGGFGQVQEVTLPWKHQRYYGDLENNSASVKLAKKELDIETEPDDHPAATWEAHGASEHTVLTILHHLKHPNILELLASYTHRGKHNLVFPIATGGDLHSFLLGVDRPEEFRSDHAIYAALAGLSSGLASLHEFKSSTFNMELMGFHHDLKPKNILVSGARFILSDFGLSKLEKRNSSRTEFKIGRGHYLAPECEDLLDRFRKGTITRASDVWSFGCILLEVLIYMRFGTSEVQAFREERKYTVGSYRTGTFFTPAGLNPAVMSWAEKLSAPTTGDPVMRRAINLVLKTLLLSAPDRLKADQLTTGLRLTTIHSLYLIALKSLQNPPSTRTTYDVSVEVQRYEAWGSTFKFDVALLDEADDTEEDLFHNALVFDHVAKSLRSMEELSSRCVMSESENTPVHFQIRAVNDALFGQLDRRQLQGANRRLEALLMPTAEDIDFKVTETSGMLYIDQALVKVVKQMHSLTAEQSLPSVRNRRIARELLQDWRNFQACHLARYHSGSDESELNVLIEWVVYDVHWADAVGVQLFERIDSLVELLSSPSNAARLRILPCRGYFHAPDRRAFGLVYELPHLSIPSEPGASEILSLRDYIYLTQDVRQRPLLGELFQFACRLAITLSGVHKTGWLHKALTSSNIVFVTSSPKSPKLADYRIIGFNHSRPDNPKEYTEAAWKRSEESRLYQHPTYLNTGSRYCVEYDYYSFGLLLLELGLWKPLPSLVLRSESKDQASAQVKASSDLTRYLLERRVPLLGQKMGKRYRDVVAFCLSVELDIGREGSVDRRPIEVQTAFDRRVIQPLSCCEL